MPRIARWKDLPAGVREHLMERMNERAISLADLNRLRIWIESEPEVPEGDWYKDFGSFKICGHGSYPKTFLLAGQLPKAAPSDSVVLPQNQRARYEG
jgi:hypothetical protein